MIQYLLAALLIFTPYEAPLAEQSILDMVNQAKTKIIVCSYGFTDLLLCDALIKAHQRGVEVSLVMDKTQAAGSKQKILVKKFIKEGIPIAIGKSSVHNQLIHAKFIVVDDEWVESGSLNYSQSGLDQDNFVSLDQDKEVAAKFTDFWHKIDNHIRGIK